MGVRFGVRLLGATADAASTFYAADTRFTPAIGNHVLCVVGCSNAAAKKIIREGVEPGNLVRVLAAEPA